MGIDYGLKITEEQYYEMAQKIQARILTRFGRRLDLFALVAMVQWADKSLCLKQDGTVLPQVVVFSCNLILKNMQEAFLKEYTEGFRRASEYSMAIADRAAVLLISLRSHEPVAMENDERLSLEQCCKIARAASEDETIRKAGVPIFPIFCIVKWLDESRANIHEGIDRNIAVNAEVQKMIETTSEVWPSQADDFQEALDLYQFILRLVGPMIEAARVK